MRAGGAEVASSGGVAWSSSSLCQGSHHIHQHVWPVPRHHPAAWPAAYWPLQMLLALGSQKAGLGEAR